MSSGGGTPPPAAPSTSKDASKLPPPEHSPKIIRKRPQSVSLARVLVYDGGCGDTSSSNNSLNSFTSETQTSGSSRPPSLGRLHHHPHHHQQQQQHQYQYQHRQTPPHSIDDPEQYRKLVNLSGCNPLFGSIGHHRRISHHHSLTIWSRGSSADGGGGGNGSSSTTADTDFNTNLLRMGSSALGKSAPTLCGVMVSGH